MPQAATAAAAARIPSQSGRTARYPQQQAASNIAADIRPALTAYFESKESPVPPPGYHHWTCPDAYSTQQTTTLLVGDPIVLAVMPALPHHITPPTSRHTTHSKPNHAVTQENLKILTQFTKLLTQACHPTLETALTAHVQPLSRTPLSYPRALRWFQPLTTKFQPLDAVDLERVTSLLELRAACTNKGLLSSAPAMQCELAMQLAQELPNFDRALTAFYLGSPLATGPSTELDLLIAHSVLRLHGVVSSQPDLWRSEGLVHVLSIAAMHMPTLADWFQTPTPDPATDDDARALAHFLDRINATPREYVQAIECFIATLNGSSSRTAQAIATTIDRLAILMNVKSDAIDESGHDLAAALASFPQDFELQHTATWTRIKAALEQSMPPSILRVDPEASCLKKRVRKNQPAAKTTASSSSLEEEEEEKSRGTW